MASAKKAVAHRTTIEIDEDLLRKAREALGTSGTKDTIVAALDEAIRAAARKRLADMIGSGKGLELTPEVLRKAKEWRSNPRGDW